MSGLKRELAVERRRGPGRKRLEEKVREDLVEKLRWLIVDKYKGNRSAFARNVGLPVPTVTGWFRVLPEEEDKDKAVVPAKSDPTEVVADKRERKVPAPELTHLVRIAEVEGVNRPGIAGGSIS